MKRSPDRQTVYMYIATKIYAFIFQGFIKILLRLLLLRFPIELVLPPISFHPSIYFFIYITQHFEVLYNMVKIELFSTWIIR